MTHDCTWGMLTAICNPQVVLSIRNSTCLRTEAAQKSAARNTKIICLISQRWDCVVTLFNKTILDNSAWSPAVPISNSAWETWLLEVTRRRWMLKISTLPAHRWRDWHGIPLVFYRARARKMLTGRWRLSEDNKYQLPQTVHFSHLSMMLKLSELSWAVCQPLYPQ